MCSPLDWADSVSTLFHLLRCWVPPVRSVSNEVVHSDQRGCRSEVRARRLTTDCVKDRKHRGSELVGVASCSLGSVVSQRLHRRVDQWQNLSPCTGSLHHAALTCWSLKSQEEVVGVAKEPPGPSANSPSGGRNQRIRGSGWFTSPFKSLFPLEKRSF